MYITPLSGPYSLLFILVRNICYFDLFLLCLQVKSPTLVMYVVKVSVKQAHLRFTSEHTREIGHTSAPCVTKHSTKAAI